MNQITRHSSHSFPQERGTVPAAILKRDFQNSWTSLFFDKTEEHELHKDNNADFTFLHTASEYEWNNKFYQMIQLPTNTVWQIILVITIVINYFWTTFFFIFICDGKPFFNYAMYITDLIYLVDFSLAVVQRCTKIITSAVGVEERSVFALVVDGITLLPMEIVYYYIARPDLAWSVLFSLRAVSFLRLYRVNVYFTDWGDRPRASHWTLFFNKFMLYLTFVLHTVACLWYISSCKWRQCDANEKSWMKSTPPGELENDTPYSSMYLLCIYYAIESVANSGLGDMVGNNELEKVVCTVSMFVGFALMIGLFIGSLSSNLVNKGRRRSLFVDKLRSINKHLTIIGVRPRRIRKIMKYYDVMWFKKRGVKEAVEVSLLPLPLQMEVFFDINIARFRSSLIFRDKDESFLRRLSLYMKNEFYLPGENIYYKNVAKLKMICISKGVVEILSDEDDESPIISLTGGTCLGEISLTTTISAKSSVRAATYTELQVLYKVDFLRMIANYPSDVYQDIRAKVDTRISSAYNKEISIDKGEILINMFVSQSRDMKPIKNLKNRLRSAGRMNSTAKITNIEAKGEKDSDVLYSDMYRLEDGDSYKLTHYICLTQVFPWIIDPNSQLSTFWEFLIFSFVLFVSFVYPFYCAYDRQFPKWLNSVSIIVDVLYLFDIYKQFTTAIYKRDCIINEVKAIIQYRMATFGFYLDVFSIFPIELLSFLIQNQRQADRIFWVLKMNRLLRLWKIPFLFYKYEQKLSSNIVILRTIKYIIYLILSAHLTGVLLYMTSCFYDICNEESWFDVTLSQDFINPNSIEDDPIVKYDNPCIISMYYALSLLSGIGFGDILPESENDVYYACGIIMAGVMLCGYCIAEFSSTFTHKSRARVEYHSTVQAVKKFMEANSLGSEIMGRVINYYQLQWNYNGGVSVLKGDHILADMSKEIQREVLAQECLKTILNIPLFKLVSADFVHLIAANARLLILPPKEVITYVGGLSREMYIIMDGFCEIMFGNTGLKTMMGPNSHFGDLEMLYGIPSIVHVCSVTHCKVVCIGYADYSQVISMFPHIAKENQDIMDEPSFKESLTKLTNYNKMYTKSKKESLTIKDLLNIRSISKRTLMSFRNSFINVHRQCHLTGENYWVPFGARRYLRLVQFFLVPWCIVPYGSFIKVWCFVRIIAALCKGIVDPFQISVHPYAIGLRNLMLALNLFAYADIYVNLHVGYFNKSGLLISHPLRTATHYLRHSFILDAIACFPFSFVLHLLKMDYFEEKENYLKRSVSIVLQLNVVLQLYRLPLAIQYLEKNIFQKTEITRLIQYSVLAIVLINMCASILIFVDCNYYDATSILFNSNSTKVEIRRSTHIHNQANTSSLGVLKCRKGSWLDNSHYKKVFDPREVYVAAYYWAACSLIGIGLGDILPQTNMEILTTLVIVIAGTLLFGYMFANIACSTASIHNNLSRYQEMMKELVDFMEKETVDKDLQKRLVEHFEYEWKRMTGINVNEMADRLNTALKEDMVLWLYENTLREVPLFENVDTSFFKVVGTEMREKYFLRGETIIRSNDVQSDMFIIHRGKVEVLSTYNEMLTCMGAGGIFGNIGMSAACCSATIVASRNLDVLVIKSETFYNILKRYPSIQKKMESVLKTAKDFIMPVTIDNIDPSDVAIEFETSDHSDVNSPLDGRRSSAATVRTNFTVTTMGTVRTTATGANLFHPKGWFHFVILPESIIFTVMAYVVLLASYVNCLLITYCFFFQDHSIYFISMGVFIDLIFYVKIFLDLRQAYLDKYGEYVIEPRKIRQKYMSKKHKLLLDIISNLPIAWFAFCAPYGYRFSTYSSLRLLQMLRFIYVLNFYEARSNILSVNKLYLKMSTILIWMTMLCHVFACFWYLVGCPMGKCKAYSWSHYVSNFPDPPAYRYLTCIYFVTSLVTTTSYGDIIAHCTNELLLVLLMMLTSKFAIALFIGDITSVVSSYTSTLVNYEYGIIELRDFLKNQNLSDHPMEKMWTYVQRLWKHGRGKQMPRFVLMAPFVLKCELMNAMYGHHLRNSYIFHNANKDFLRQLTVRLQRYIFFKGNYIVQDGDTDQNMYFIHRGEVEILTVHPDLTETIYDTLKPGDMFGVVQGLYYGIPHHFSFRAKTSLVDILYLNLDSWYTMLRYFEDVSELIYQRANNLYSSM